MTGDKLADVRITSEDDFRAVLSELFEKALHADVDVRGAWEFRSGGSVHNWEVEVVELAREEGTDDDEE